MSNILSALAKLDVANDDHWTGDGLPRVDVIETLLGSKITRAEVTAAARSFNRLSPELPEVVAQVPTADPVPDLPTYEDADEAEAHDELTEAEAELAALELQRVALEQRRAELERQRDEIIEANTPANDHIANQIAIRDYLDSQQRAREERGATRRALAEANLNLGELAASLRSPIDSAFSRKNGRGAGRPTR